MTEGFATDYGSRVQYQSRKIVAVGSVAFDSIETPEGKVNSVLGGSANYFSLAASHFSRVSVVGVVGEDFPQSHLKWLQEHGIDVTGIERKPGKTFHWVGKYNRDLNQAETLSTMLNVFETFDPKLSPSHQESDYVFLANIDPVLQLRVLDQVRKPKLVACDSMNFWITGKPKELRDVLKRVDLISLNEGEAYLLSEERNIRSAAGKIREMGPKTVVIKRGEYGALLHTEHDTFIIPAFPLRKVVDPTGAGDSFAGAMLGFLAQEGVEREQLNSKNHTIEKTLRRAVIAGCVLASFTVEDFSFRRLMTLGAEELKLRESEFIKMTQLG